MANSGALASSSSLQWQRASELELIRKIPKFIPLQTPAISLLKNGLQRGAIAEIVGRRSSGRTACLLHILAQATQSGEVCAVVDTHNQFHPASAQNSGVLLERIVWVRCDGNVEHAIRATDLLLHAGGFGVVALDLCETSAKHLDKIPLSYWFRFRRAIESTPTILVLMGHVPQAKSCSVNHLELKSKAPHWAGALGFRLLRGLFTSAALHKPVQSRAEQLTLAG